MNNLEHEIIVEIIASDDYNQVFLQIVNFYSNLNIRQMLLKKEFDECYFLLDFFTWITST
jgi:hypothetical protein